MYMVEWPVFPFPMLGMPPWQSRFSFKIDGFVKSPSAALRFTFVAAAYHPSTPHSSCFARLASGVFYEAIALATLYEIIKISR